MKFRRFEKVACVHSHELRRDATNAGTLLVVFPAMSIKFLFFIFLITVQLLPDSQTETDSLTKSDETEEGWKNEALLDANNTNESWEDEVEDRSVYFFLSNP